MKNRKNFEEAVGYLHVVVTIVKQVKNIVAQPVAESSVALQYMLTALKISCMELHCKAQKF